MKQFLKCKQIFILVQTQASSVPSSALKHMRTKLESFPLQIKDAKQSLVHVFKQKGAGSELLEMLLPNIAMDMDIDVGNVTVQCLSRCASALSQFSSIFFRPLL